MIGVQLEIIMIACVTSAACALPGTYLVLRKMSMISDAISHSMILGIVVAFFFVKTLDSPFLVLAAAMVGLLTVMAVELLIKTRLVKEDAAIGVVYPFFFSIAIILISLFASNVHIDTDSVLMGELAFSTLNRFIVGGKDIGPVALYQICAVLFINIIFILLFYKELKVTVFDEEYAQTIGFAPKRIMHALMFMVAVTIVVSFEIAGAIMVVGFIVGPPIIAMYYTKRLDKLLIFAPVAGVIASFFGYWTSHIFDVSIAGSIVTIIGLLFFASFMLAPKRGLVYKWVHSEKVRTELKVNMLLVHLWQHKILGNDNIENCPETILTHLAWKKERLDNVIKICQDRGYLEIENDVLVLKKEGINRAEKAIEK